MVLYAAYTSNMGLDPSGPGAQAVADAFGFQGGQIAADYAKEAVEADDSIPAAKKDQIRETLDAVVDANGLDSPKELEEAMAMIKDMQKDMITDEIEETANNVSGGGTEESANKAGAGEGSGGSQNWLVALAKAMSRIAGKHLEQMVNKQEKLGEMEDAAAASEADYIASTPERSQFSDDEAGAAEYQKASKEHAAAKTGDLGAQAANMTKLTAEIQAHTQMFKMMQETMTTVIKTVGEALNGTVRKQ